MNLLERKVCVVTGAARGIGKAIAIRLADDGAVVYAIDRLEGEIEKWSNEYDRIKPIYLDVTDSGALKSALLSIFKENGKIDCMVNNAAMISNKKIGMIVKDEVTMMYNVNVFAVIDNIQIVSRLMARCGGGVIINMASITGVVGSPGQLAYSSTKGAIISITKSAAKELASLKIRVNAVAPGIIRTERFAELYESDGDKINARIEKIGLGRLGTPEDVANAVSFLASDRADYISGQVLGVDGCASI